MMLAVNNLSHAKGNKALFRHVSFTMAPGQRVLVQGANGAGKSTLLKIVAGLLSPDKGNIQFQGCLLSQMSYLGHQNSLKKALTPLENIAELLSLANCLASDARIDEVLTDLGLTHQRNQLCGSLSAGECRKVALAVVILKNRPLWILDEPFNSLDKVSYDKLQGYCQQHLAQGGMILLSSHQGSQFYEGCHVICLST